MGFGRVVCVFVPFALTVASIITLLVACLAGITAKDQYNFKINTTNLSIPASDISNLLSSRSVPLPIYERDAEMDLEKKATATIDDRADGSSLLSSASAVLATATSASDAESSLTNTDITASDLSLADAYYVSVWNYCEKENNGSTTCSKGKFNWASDAVKSFEKRFSDIASSGSSNASLPKSFKEELNVFSTVVKWTEICFIIAFIFLGATIVFGIFANCTRFFSICATLVAVAAAVAVVASAGLATASAVVVVTVAKGSAKKYGLTASYNSHFLANVWLSAAFIIAAVLFWTFSICCCAPDHHRSGRRGAGRKGFADDASMVGQAGGASTGRGYQRIGNPDMPAMSSAYSGAGYGHGEAANYYNNNHSGSAYEPYKHTAA